jgi:hypothetical protein
MGSPVGCCQVSKKERYDGIAVTAAMAAANMQPIKTFVMMPDRLSTCAGARRTSCPAKRSAGADELVDTLMLPPASLVSCLSPSLDTCASQAACTRQSGSSGSVGALMFAGRTTAFDSSFFIGVISELVGGALKVKKSPANAQGWISFSTRVVGYSICTPFRRWCGCSSPNPLSD